MGAVALARIRTLVTLLVLAGLVAFAVQWGWSRMTAPLPGSSADVACVDTTVEAGTKVYPDQVAVSVLNAGTRNGLATETMDALVEAGFVEADSANAPDGTKVGKAQIWTDQPQSPAVKLVRSHLGKGVQVVRRDPVGLGVNVVVGNKFRKVTKGRQAFPATDDVTICSPPAPAGGRPSCSPPATRRATARGGRAD